MTPEQAQVWNEAINSALRAYQKGYGAIEALKVRYAVMVEHIGTTTKQEVVDLGEAKNDG